MILEITVATLVLIELIRLGVYVWQVTHEPLSSTTDEFKLWLEADEQEPKEKKRKTQKVGRKNGKGKS